ncbi:hypothetical protein M1403_02815 [Patescibacteria group bacterium]|nr:hypothetical protein [Patescibacteria group bacterium]
MRGRNTPDSSVGNTMQTALEKAGFKRSPDLPVLKEDRQKVIWDPVLFPAHAAAAQGKSVNPEFLQVEVELRDIMQEFDEKYGRIPGMSRQDRRAEALNWLQLRTHLLKNS